MDFNRNDSQGYRFKSFKDLAPLYDLAPTGEESEKADGPDVTHLLEEEEPVSAPQRWFTPQRWRRVRIALRVFAVIGFLLHCGRMVEDVRELRASHREKPEEVGQAPGLVSLLVHGVLKEAAQTAPDEIHEVVATLLGGVEAGGPESVALAEILVQAEERGATPLPCGGVAVVYVPPRPESQHSDLHNDSAELRAVAFASTLEQHGFVVKGLDLYGTPWTSLAPADLSPLSGEGQRILHVWTVATGACVSLVLK